MEPKLGKLIQPGQEAKRDAVHIAIAPVVAAEPLVPGQHVGIAYVGKFSHVSSKRKHIGIIDPLLTHELIPTGTYCWLWLYPGSTTGMRHHWEHPAFVGEGEVDRDRSYSEVWLTKFAEELGMTYDELIKGIRDKHFGSSDKWDGEDVRDAVLESKGVVLQHYAVVTGEIIGDRGEDIFFSCGC